MNYKDFDCDNCKWGRHCDEENPAPLNQFIIENGSNKFESAICFKPMITDKSHSFMRLHEFYSDNVMPFSQPPYGSGILEQPYIFMQAMEIIDNAMGGVKSGN